MTLRASAALLFILLTATGAGQNRVRLAGNVRDADGNPLELVVVQVKNTLTGAMTNEQGFYSLEVAPADSLTVVFSCLGFNKAERIIPSARADMRLNVQMNPAVLSLGEVSVTAARRQIGTLERVDADKVRLLPDPSGGSIESLVVTHAGVSSANELSTQYSVRGGSYDENIVYVNGLEVFRPLLIRSGQQEGLSFVNPSLTETVSFSAGGFEARYGDKMSSVLDITYKKPEKTEGSVSASLLGANAYVGSAAGNYRQVTGFRYKTGRSLLKTMDTDAEYNPDFIDLQTYMSYGFAPGWEVNFLGNLAVNNFRFIPHSRETKFGTINNRQNFSVFFEGKEKDKFQTLFGALTLKRTFTANTEAGLQLSAFSSREEESYDIAGTYWLSRNDDEEGEGGTMPLSPGSYHEHARNQLQASVINAGHYGSVRTKGNTFRWGASAQLENIADRISEWDKRDSAGYSMPRGGGGDVRVFSNLYSDNELASARISGYVQDVFKFRTPRGLFTLTGGVRGSYWTYNREFIFSPRASLGFIPNFNQSLTFRLATGVYYQPPFYKELRVITKDGEGNDIVALNEGLKSQRSIHFILGGDCAFRAVERNFRFTAELYYKKLDNLNPYTVDNVKIRYYGENCAEGYAMGIDMKLFGEFVPGTDSWISLSFMKAGQTIRKAVKAPLPNNPGYNLSLFFQDYLPGYQRVKLNLRGILSGRLPVTLPRKGYEDSYYETTPYRRADLGLSYRYLKNVWIGVDVFNLFDIKNTSSYYWISDANNQSAAVPNYLTGRQFNFRLIADF
jgi:hypothetical protein